MKKLIKTIILNIPASFFFAVGFASQIVAMTTDRLASLFLVAAMRTTTKKDFRAKLVAACRNEVTKWENEKGKL